MAKDRKRRDDIFDDDDFDDLDPLSDLAAEVVDDDDIEIPQGGGRQKPTTPEHERFPPLLDDYEDEPEPRPIRHRPEPAARHGGRGAWRYNLLSCLFLIGSIVACGYYALVWTDPFTRLNPLAPPTPFIEVSATPDPVAVAQFEATLAAASVTPPTPIPTVAPSVTPQGQTAPESTEEPTPLITPRPEFTFSMQEPGVIYRPRTGPSQCTRQVITGAVTSADGRLLDGFRVQIIDAQEPERFTVSVAVGASPDLGPGVYEQLLGTTPRARRYTIQLFDLQGLAVSEPYLIFTRDDCESIIAEINFGQIR